MKRLVPLICLILCAFFSTRAQVSTIPFSQSLDSYLSISGTVVDAPNEDDVFHANLPLGFSVNYNGAMTSKFGICTNGFIVMDSLSHSGLWLLNSSSIKVVSILHADLQNTNTGGHIEYVTVGTAPNRVCIIQWRDYGVFGVPYCHLNAQIRIHESTGCIQLYYGYNAYSNAAGKTFYAGLTGDTTSDFNLRSATSNWANSFASATLTGTGMIMNPLTIIPNGLVFSFGSCPSSGTQFSYITGNVYNDANGNGVKDAGENGLANIIVNEATQNYYTSTDSSGDYAMLFVDSALTYSLHALPMTYWNITSSPLTYSINPLTQSCSSADFGMQATPNVHDVSITANAGNIPWPNANVTIFATYHNGGTVVESGDSIFFVKDSHLSFTSSTPAPALVSGDSLVWTYSNLLINEFRNITLHLQADTTITMGDTLHSSWTIHPLSGDAAPANNHVVHNQACMLAFDPNIKTVSPDGNILNTQELAYTIHFQNTGTGSAVNVFIRDTLDANLDINTFKLTGFSHPLSYTINGAGQLLFTFANIFLPDSNSNEPASHGLVSYTIKPKTTLASGSQIHNTASIVFDYNTPIVTNTTQNIIIENIPNAIGNVDVADNSIMIYPNPAHDAITLASSTAFKQTSITLSDISGKVLLQKEYNGGAEIHLDLSALPKGVYLMAINDAGRVVRKKVVKQ